MITGEVVREGIMVSGESEECIHRVYDREQAHQIEEERHGFRSNQVRRLGDIMHSLSPHLLAELRATTYQPLTPEQVEINREGYAELAQVVADLEKRRR